MANNTTTTWRWEGAVSGAWEAANWLDADGVPVDDWPTGNLPTHLVKFLTADEVVPWATGPWSSVTVLSIEAENGPVLFGDDCGIGLVVGTLTLKYACTLASGTYGVVHIQPGALTNIDFDESAHPGTLVVNDLYALGPGSVNIIAGTINRLLYFDEPNSALSGGTLNGCRVVVKRHVEPLDNARADLSIDGCVFEIYEKTTILHDGVHAFDVAGHNEVRIMRREVRAQFADVPLPGWNSGDDLFVTAAHAYGFGGGIPK